MERIFQKRGFDYFLIALTIFLVIFSWRKFIFSCTPIEAEGMLGYFHFAKKAILQYHSFPHFSFGYSKFKNATVATFEYFSFPETPLLTPFLVFYLFLEVDKAEKISLAIHLILGVIGIFALGRSFKLSRAGTILWAILFLQSVNVISLYLSFCINWKTLFLFPWIFYFYINCYQNKKFILLAALFNLLILFEGGIHIFIWTNLFIGIFGILNFLVSRRFHELVNLLEFFLFQALIGSIKIIPMLHFFKGYKPLENTFNLHAGINPPYSIKDFFTALTTQFWGAEYSNYIGVLGIILFLSAIFAGLKLNKPILFTSLFFTLLTVKFDGLSLFYLIRKLPIMDTQRVPPRFFVMAIFGFGLLSGLLITNFQQKIKKLGERSIFLFEAFILIFISYIYFDLNRAFNLFQRGCNLLEFSEHPVFFSYIPKIIPQGDCNQGFSNPNLRIWKLKLKENAYAVFDELDWKLYKNVLKFEIFRNGRFEKIYSQPYNGSVSLPIPKDATILRMKYDSPYFKAGLVISLISLVLACFYVFNAGLYNFTYKLRK